MLVMSREPWRKLNVGDRIRIVRMPSDEPTMFPETRRLFKQLIARNRPSRIFWIDEYKHPWIQCRIREKNGWRLHWLAVNDDSWEPVRKRDGL